MGAVAKVLPALGFALLLNLLLEKNLIPYLIIGFCLSAYLGLSSVGVAAVSIALAWIIYLERSRKMNTAMPVSASADNSDDDEEGDTL